MIGRTLNVISRRGPTDGWTRTHGEGGMGGRPGQGHVTDLLEKSDFFII